MKVLVVLAHQRVGSFCHAITEVVLERLTHLGHEGIPHDLYVEGFDPVLPDGEIKKGSPAAPFVEEHSQQLVEADGIVFVHPNWWAQPPAILKGWLDRVLRQGVAYDFAGGKVVGLLTGKKAVVFTTSNTPREMELELYGDPLQNLWENCILKFCGITDFERRNFESMVMSTPEQRQAWLQETGEIVERWFPKK